MNDIRKKLDEEWAAIAQKDLKAKEKNTLVGRYITEPFADSNAVYEIIKENKKTVRMKALTEYGDGWVIPYWGTNPTVEKAYIIDKIKKREMLNALFNKKK